MSIFKTQIVKLFSLNKQLAQYDEHFKNENEHVFFYFHRIEFI